MSVYAVGDVQGCYEPLRRLLERVAFDPGRDRLWLVGDLVNRGPQSLEVLRYVRALGESAAVVLGNHDLHLILRADGVRAPGRRDTLDAVLTAPDAAELIAWLRARPLLHHDLGLAFCMVHAGIPPQWDLAMASALAREAEACIRLGGKALDEASRVERLEQPWRSDLTGAERIAMILASLTRLRFCTEAGRLELRATGVASAPPPGFLPWFSHPTRRTRDVRIVFGHWAALDGHAEADNVFALDTGCVWGRHLTLLRLEDLRRFSCPCAPPEAS